MTIIEIAFDTFSGQLTIQINLWTLLVLTILLACVIFIARRVMKKKAPRHKAELKELKLKVGGVEAKYEIEQNYQNLEVAHKIYIELVTRKAALPINEDHDVIVEIYDSWYTLFSITREELKSIAGSEIKKEKTEQLTQLLTDVLNKGLRPHLTEHQARFRKWYNEKLKVDNTNTPQQIQKGYPKYAELIASLKTVNEELKGYAEALNHFIHQ